MLRERAETRDGDEVGSRDCPGLRRKDGQALSSSGEGQLVTAVWDDTQEN